MVVVSFLLVVHCTQRGPLHDLDVQLKQVNFFGGEVQAGELLVEHAVVQTGGAAKADAPLGLQGVENVKRLVVLGPHLGDIEVGLGKPCSCQLPLAGRSCKECMAYGG